MALLIGQEAEGAEAEVSAAIERPVGFTFKALKTGTLTALHIKFSANGTGTKSRIAIQADEAGKPKVGALAEGGITSNTAGEHEATGLSVEVTEGTTYWLTFLPLAGSSGSAKYKPGSTTGRRVGNVARTTIAAVEAADWLGSANKGPISIWGTGTEGGGGAKVQAVSGSLSFAGTLPRSTLHQLAASLTPAGALPRNIVRALSASLSFTGSLPRKVLHAFSASLSFFGSLPASKTGEFVKKLTATLSFAGTLQRNTTKQLPAVLELVGANGSVTPEETPFITGTQPLKFLKVTHQLPAALSPAGALTRAIRKPLTASLSFAGSLPRKIKHGFQAGLLLSAELVPGGGKVLEFLWSLAGGSPKVYSVGGDTTVTYSAAAESEAVHAYAGDG